MWVLDKLKARAKTSSSSLLLNVGLKRGELECKNSKELAETPGFSGLGCSGFHERENILGLNEVTVEGRTTSTANSPITQPIVGY